MSFRTRGCCGGGRKLHTEPSCLQRASSPPAHHKSRNDAKHPEAHVLGFPLKQRQVGSGLRPELHGSTCSTVHRGWCLGIIGLVTAQALSTRRVWMGAWRFSAATRESETFNFDSLFSRGFQVICVAHPGEVIFVPAGWWLDVEGLRVSRLVRLPRRFLSSATSRRKASGSRERRWGFVCLLIARRLARTLTLDSGLQTIAILFSFVFAG